VTTACAEPTDTLTEPVPAGTVKVRWIATCLAVTVAWCTAGETGLAAAIPAVATATAATAGTRIPQRLMRRHAVNSIR
jgi:uncharacterized membrane protein